MARRLTDKQRKAVFSEINRKSSSSKYVVIPQKDVKIVKSIDKTIIQ